MKFLFAQCCISFSQPFFPDFKTMGHFSNSVFLVSIIASLKQSPKCFALKVKGRLVIPHVEWAVINRHGRSVFGRHHHHHPVVNSGASHIPRCPYTIVTYCYGKTKYARGTGSGPEQARKEKCRSSQHTTYSLTTFFSISLIRQKIITQSPLFMVRCHIL